MKKHLIALIVVWMGCVLSNAVDLPRLSQLEAGPRGDKSLFAEPWEIWMRQPINTPVLIETTAMAASGTEVAITMGGFTNTLVGVGCASLTSTNRFYPNLRSHVPYNVTVSGANWSEVNLNFKGYVPRGILPLRGTHAIPRPYQVFVNGEELLDVDTLQFAFTCGNNSTNFTLEIRPDRGFRPAFLGSFEEQWSSDEDEDTHAAPGDGGWLQMGPGRSSAIENTAFRWSVNLGKLINGLTAGKLRLTDETISSNVFNGRSLSYSARTTNSLEVHVLTTNGLLRQIRTLQALTDISSSVSPTEECVIKFYTLQNVGGTTNSSGLYPILTNSPFVTWRLKNPNAPGTYTQLQIVEERPASRIYTADLQLEGTNVWKLAYGSGSDERIERRTVILSGPSRRETVTIGSPSSTVYKAIEDYQRFDWGWELTNVVTNPDGQSLTNRFSYHTNAADLFSYSKLYERWHPGDRWEIACYPHYNGSYYEATGWPIGDVTEFPTLGNVTRITPWEDGPIAPGNGDTNVLFTHTAHDSGAIDIHASTRITSERYLADSIYLLSYEVEMNGDYENGSLTCEDSRLQSIRGLLLDQLDRTKRFRFLGHWLNNLVRWHEASTYQTDLFEYTPGTLSGFNWTSDTNALDFRIIKTTGAKSDELSVYPMASYFAVLSFDGTYQAIDCVQGKSVQEVSYLKAGSIALKELWGMWGVTNVGGTNVPLWAKINSEQMSYDSLGHLTNITWINGANPSVSRVIYESNWRDGSGNDTELKRYEVFESGERVDYAHDTRKRRITATLANAGANGVYPALASVSTTGRITPPVGRCKRLFRAAV